MVSKVPKEGISLLFLGSGKDMRDEIWVVGDVMDIVNEFVTYNTKQVNYKVYQKRKVKIKISNIFFVRKLNINICFHTFSFGICKINM